MYKPEILASYAASFDKQAKSVEATWGIGLTVSGAVIGALLGKFLHLDLVPVALLLGAIGLAFGIGIGADRAFALRVRAQQIWIDLEQEKHLRVIAQRMGG